MKRIASDITQIPFFTPFIPSLFNLPNNFGHTDSQSSLSLFTLQLCYIILLLKEFAPFPLPLPLFKRLAEGSFERYRKSTHLLHLADPSRLQASFFLDIIYDPSSRIRMRHKQRY